MIDRASPDAMQYFRAAQMHRESATELLADCPTNSAAFLAHEVIYLSGYIVECVLKALIVSRTPPKKRPARLLELRTEIKHNLDKLRKVLASQELVLPLRQAKDFRTVNSEWTAEMRYFPRKRLRDDAAFVQQAALTFYGWAE